MRLKIKRENALDYIILWGLILQIVIVRWLNIHEQFNFIIVSLICIRFANKPKLFFSRRTVAALSVFIGYSFLNWIILGGTSYLFFKNLWRILKTLIIVWYFSGLIKNKGLFAVNFFKKLFLFFNIYMLINIPIIIAQLSGHYVLLGLRSDYQLNSVDFVSGLFGVYGMPRLNLYLLFLFYYNLTWLKQRKKNLKYYLFLAYNILLILLWAIRGINIDNKGFYVCILIYAISYYVSNNSIRKSGNKIKTRGFHFWKRIALIVAFGIVLLYVGARVNNSVAGMINQIFEAMNSGITKMNATGGTNERFGMIAYALSNPQYRWFGAGIGKIATDTSWGFGFAHFGQSDLGAYMCVAGLLFAIALIYYVYQMEMEMYKERNYAILFTILSVILSVYSQIFTDAGLTNGFLFFQLICYSQIYSSSLRNKQPLCNKFDRR